MLSPAQIARVQDSFLDCLIVPDHLASRFYDRLFEAAPETRRMFTRDMVEQGRKLVITLAAVVDGLDRLDEIMPVAQDLAVRHLRYGVVEAHYALVGAALLDALGELLGPGFDEETRDAWQAAYALISGAMIRAAHQVA